MTRDERKILSTKQKEAIKEEIVYLQNKIDDLHLSKKYTIKSLYFNSINDGNRSVCINFNEKYKSYGRMMNHFAMVNIFNNDYPSDINGIRPCKRFVCSGVLKNIYDEDGELIKYEDDDIQKIDEMLIEEYWIWLKRLDKYYFNWKTFEDDGSSDDVESWSYEFDKNWDVMRRTAPKYTQHTMEFYVDMFNKQVNRGLFIDAAVNEIFYKHIDRKPFTIEQLNTRLFY